MPSEVLTPIAIDPLDEGTVQVEVTLSRRPTRRIECKTQLVGVAWNSESRSRIPRITRLMALAIKFQGMVDRGEVRDYAELARLGYVTRARLTQIMNLLLLAPEFQSGLVWGEWRGRSGTATERDLRSIIANPVWADQRALVAEQCPYLSAPRTRSPQQDFQPPPAR